MKNITRNVWALIAIGIMSVTTYAQSNPIKHKRTRPEALTSITQKFTATTTYLNVGIIAQLPCSTDFEVSLTISNPGTEDLTSATINYTIDGFPATYQWTGNLVAGGEETATFVVPNTTTGTHTLGATVSALNGNTDGLPAESYNEAFTINALLSTPAPTITVRIQPDNFPDEISWELKTNAGAVVAQGSNYNPDPNIVGIISVPVAVNPDECYTFTIHDEFGDGICCNDNGEGFYQILNSNNQPIFTNSPYTFSDSVSFGITEQPAAVAQYTLNNIKLYPNPASGVINLEIPNGMALPDGFTIYNSLGQVVNNGAVSQYNQQINIAGYTGGVYFIKLTGGTATKTIQFIKD